MSKPLALFYCPSCGMYYERRVPWEMAHGHRVEVQAAKPSGEKVGVWSACRGKAVEGGGDPAVQAAYKLGGLDAALDIASQAQVA